MTWVKIVLNCCYNFQVFSASSFTQIPFKRKSEKIGFFLKLLQIDSQNKTLGITRDTYSTPKIFLIPKLTPNAEDAYCNGRCSI